MPELRAGHIRRLHGKQRSRGSIRPRHCPQHRAEQPSFHPRRDRVVVVARRSMDEPACRGERAGSMGRDGDVCGQCGLRGRCAAGGCGRELPGKPREYLRERRKCGGACRSMHGAGEPPGPCAVRLARGRRPVCARTGIDGRGKGRGGRRAFCSGAGFGFDSLSCRLGAGVRCPRGGGGRCSSRARAR